MSDGSIQVDASFMQTLWNVQPTCSGSNVAVGQCTIVFFTFFTKEYTEGTMSVDRHYIIRFYNQKQ